MNALDQLCARGPWAGRDDDRKPWTLTGADLRALYDQVATGAPIPDRSARRTDRALQLLRRAGLIRYVGGQWVAAEVAR